MPRFVVLNNEMMDLNSLIGSKPLIVKPGYPVANSVAVWELLSLNQSASYLWCELTAAEKFDSSDTPMSDGGVITIEAAVVAGRAMLTQKPAPEEIYS